jgi:hypothetical protein
MIGQISGFSNTKSQKEGKAWMLNNVSVKKLTSKQDVVIFKSFSPRNPLALQLSHFTVLNSSDNPAKVALLQTSTWIFDSTLKMAAIYNPLTNILPKMFN